MIFATKMDTKLYRCYDNRLRSTERRPHLYKVCPDIFGECIDVLEIVDRTAKGDDALQFGERQKSTPSWLWEYRGRLLIISTPFHDGVHYATCPKHFIPIVEHLDKMHQNGFVHGDIRAFNMVLKYSNDESKEEGNSRSEHDGWLIDFDFGGKVCTDLTTEVQHSHGYLNPTYPSGYKFNLEDGFRLGRPGNDINKSHDWYALGHIIFVLHEVVHPEDDVTESEMDVPLTTEQQRIEDQKSHLARLQRAFTRFEGDYSKLQNPGDSLKRYLNFADKYNFKLVPTNVFKTFLKEYNMLTSRERRIDSKGATGSPIKRK